MAGVEYNSCRLELAHRQFETGYCCLVCVGWQFEEPHIKMHFGPPSVVEPDIQLERDPALCFDEAKIRKNSHLLVITCWLYWHIFSTSRAVQLNN